MLLMQKSFVALVAVLVVAVDAFYVKNETAEESKEKIISGHQVDISSRPYQISLRAGDLLCGGSIISPSHILTAAHCVGDYVDYPSAFKVRSGSSYHDRGGVISQVSRVIRHEGYTGITDLSNDLAILVLTRPLQFNSNTQQIQLASQSPRDGERAQISGWGLTESMQAPSTVLLATSVPVTTQDFNCRSGAEKICTASSSGANSCMGDSGGPVTVGGVLAGVVSEGDARGCGLPNVPDLHSSVAYFRNWIASKMGEQEPSPDSDKPGFDDWNPEKPENEEDFDNWDLDNPEFNEPSKDFDKPEFDDWNHEKPDFHPETPEWNEPSQDFEGWEERPDHNEPPQDFDNWNHEKPEWNEPPQDFEGWEESPDHNEPPQDFDRWNKDRPEWNVPPQDFDNWNHEKPEWNEPPQDFDGWNKERPDFHPERPEWNEPSQDFDGWNKERPDFQPQIPEWNGPSQDFGSDENNFGGWQDENSDDSFSDSWY